MFSALLVYIFREYIRSTVVEEVSNVASRSLEDEMVKNKAQQLSVALTHAILDDPNTKTNTGILSEHVVFTFFSDFCLTEPL